MDTKKNKNEDLEKEADKEINENSPLKPDPETLHTTDPQEHMEGPVSSLVQEVKKEAEKK